MTRFLWLGLCALLCITSCMNGHNGSAARARFEPTPEERAALQQIVNLIAAAKGLRNHPDVTRDQRRRIDMAIAEAERAMRHLVEVRAKGRAQVRTEQAFMVAAGLIVADDPSGIGMLDNPMLVFLGIGVVATHLLSQAPATRDELARAMKAAGRAMEGLQMAIRPATRRAAEPLPDGPKSAPRPVAPPVSREDMDRRRQPKCKPQPVCPHRGEPPHDIHNRCADALPPNKFQGCDVLVNGKLFDAIGARDDVLWEIKTADWSNRKKYKEFIRKREYDQTVKDARTEQTLAAECGYRYVMAIADDDLFAALSLDPALRGINVIHVPQCRRQ